MKRVIWAAALVILAAQEARGTEVKHFRAATRQELAAGDHENVALDSLGRLLLAQRVERLAALEEPYLFSAAVHPRGWVAGTGNGGKVLLVDRAGKTETLFTADEPAIFAVHVDADGTVYAASSPAGKVYRLRDGRGEVVFDPEETYIWALARGTDGSLLVATGLPGRVYRVDSKGRAKLLWDGGEAHARGLAVLPNGDLAIGTAEEGRVVRLTADGVAQTLYDSSLTEVVSVAAGADGEIWAAVISSEASLIDSGAAKSNGKAKEEVGGEGAEAAVSVTTEDEAETPAAAGSGARRSTSKSIRSEVLRIPATGVVETVHSFEEETVFAVRWMNGELWIATGVEGNVYRHDGTALVLEQDLEDREVIALLPEAGRMSFAATNAAAFYRATGGPAREGTYTSVSLDAGQAARFGTFHWDGDLPPSTAARFAFRSGFTAEPDATWSDWSADQQGHEISLSAVPRGRYVQWRAAFAANGELSPSLASATLSYRQDNQRPLVRTLSVLEPGQILVPAGFNPGNQAYEPASPNRDGIFTTLAPAGSADEGGGRQKTLWKKGYRTLRWEAVDPNEDTLRYRLEVRRDGAAAWLPMAADLKETFWSFDATVLPDGLYRFRLSASDERSNAEGALQGERVTEAVTIDHTPPTLSVLDREGTRLRLRVRDASSPLRELAVSIDAAAWSPARSTDGLVDSREETVELEVPVGAKMVLVRAIDAAFNAETFDVTPGTKGGR